MDIDAELQKMIEFAAAVGEYGLSGLLGAVRLTLHDDAWKALLQKYVAHLLAARQAVIAEQATKEEQ